MYIFLYMKKIMIIFSLIFITVATLILTQLGYAKESIRVPVIMYHHILKDESKSNDYIITPKQFEEDLNFLKKNGYTTVLVRDIINYVEGKGELPEKPVILSFDDGHESIYRYIYPLIKKNNHKIIISVVGKYSEEFSKTEESHINYSYLKWKQIKEMNESSLVEIGSHTYDCHSADKRKGIKKLKNESLEEYEEFLENDLAKLNNLLSEINITPVTFTYPFGYTDKNSIKIIKRMGFKASLGCEEGINIIEKNNSECLFNLKRYNRPSEITTEKFFKSIL